MRNKICALLLLFLPHALRAQSPLTYQLAYASPGDTRVHITITLPQPLNTPAYLVMPRTYPGGYEQILYDPFVEQIHAFSPTEKSLSVAREPDGPRWTIGEKGEHLQRIEYQVDLAQMESRILSAVETSKVRPRYLGLLGYSVFAFIDGLENQKINLRITAPPSWPILTTLDPQVPAPASTTEASAADFYALADSQILMGPDLQLQRFPGKTPLILAVYSETAEDLDIDGQPARQALDRVQTYFGDTPFRQYTVQLELLRPFP